MQIKGLITELLISFSLCHIVVINCSAMYINAFIYSEIKLNCTTVVQYVGIYISMIKILTLMDGVLY